MKKTIMAAVYPARLTAAIWIIMLCMSAGNLAAQTTRYIKPVSTGTGDGSSWTNASNDLQVTINNSAFGDLIFVAAGTYKALSGFSYSMKNGVKIYGGFAGTETLLSQRNWIINVTILQGNGNSVIINLNNGLTTASVLDGFTITGGNGSFGGGMENHYSSPLIANCSFSGNSNSGMYNLSSAPQVINCSFSGNSASGGGGMCNNGSPAIITNCDFSGNSSSSGGGGVFNVGSSPVITNCSFSGNSAYWGGGMYNLNSSPVITNGNFSDNEGIHGGGMYNQNASPAIINSSFSRNNVKKDGTAGGVGGGIANIVSSPSLSGCSFTNNNAYSEGGGMYNSASIPSLTNCNFLANTAGVGGGLSNNSHSDLTITNCTFSGNVANGLGGAIVNYGSNPVIRSSTFSGNTAQSDGGAMANSGSLPTISNCIFSGNKAVSSGGAMDNRFSSNTIITNCSFSGNTAPDGGCISNRNGAALVVNNSVIRGNSSAITNNGSTTTVQYSIVQGGYAGTGNLDVDPRFISAPDYTTAPFTGGNYRIQTCSPAFNAGSNALIPPGITTDFAGGPRINSVSVDMGAYEYAVQPGNDNILYVNPGVTGGSGNGSSWANALSLLTEALVYAKANEINWSAANPLKIFVATGTYKPLYRPDNLCASVNASDRDNTFSMTGNVQVYGGFDPSSGIDSLTDTRIVGAGGSVLSGDIGAVNNSSDNCYHVIIYSGIGGGAATLDGFTVTGGNANGSSMVTVSGNTIGRNNGGGIYCYGSSPIIVNCTISGNTTANYGGGIYGIIGTNFNASNCTFSNNTGAFGGAVFNDQTLPSITNCTFSNNSSTFGGALFNHGAGPTIGGSSFSGNSASTYGGAVYNNGAVSPVYNNCNFSGNSAQLGGSMFNNLSTAVITNCGFSGNSASNNGGGIYNYAASFPSILNCTFLSNTAGITGGGMYSEPASGPTITGSLFAGNNTQFGGAMYNGGNATVTGCSFSNNWAATYGGAVYNGGLSPVYTNCIFSGNVAVNAGSGGGAMFNNNSTASVINNTFSGNAASFGGAIHNFNITSAFIRNTVIWGNSSGIYNESTAGALVDFTLIQGGYAGSNNLNINPLFINAAVPAGADGIWGTIDDGLRPQVCSPIINAGNNSMITAGVVTDVAGHSRMQLVKVDLGAYEANSFANAAAANIATSNTVTSGWQIPNGQTFYSINCSTLAAAVTGDGTATSISGNTTAKVWIESSQPMAFVKRHYEITPQEVNPTTATGIITLYFTQAEFNDFNAANIIKLPQGPADAAGKANLLIEKRGGISNNTTGLPNSYTGAIATINPDDANITWNATNLRWEISFPVTGFSGFFVKTYSFTLPLRLVSFSAEEKNCTTTLQWITKDEINVSHFEVEQSIDGILFNVVKTIPAKNTGNENNYAVNVPVVNDRTFYRLKMVDIDGKITYSQVTIITSFCGNKILVSPNPVKDKLYIRNASVGSQYVIYDNTGKRISSGRIFNTAQEVFITSIAPGIYYISITDKNGSNKKVSFLKE